jgi:spore coat protein CotF
MNFPEFNAHALIEAADLVDEAIAKAAGTVLHDEIVEIVWAAYERQDPRAEEVLRAAYEDLKDRWGSEA